MKFNCSEKNVNIAFIFSKNKTWAAANIFFITSPQTNSGNVHLWPYITPTDTQWVFLLRLLFFKSSKMTFPKLHLLDHLVWGDSFFLPKPSGNYDRLGVFYFLPNVNYEGAAFIFIFLPCLWKKSLFRWRLALRRKLRKSNFLSICTRWT